MVTNALGRSRGPHARINTSRWSREDLSQRDLGTSRILRGKWLEVSAHETTVQSCTDVVGMTLCMVPSCQYTGEERVGGTMLTNHETEVEQPVIIQLLQPTTLFPEQDTRNDCCTG